MSAYEPEHLDGWEPCLRCNGTGTVYEDREEFDCPDCDGLGEVADG